MNFLEAHPEVSSSWSENNAFSPDSISKASRKKVIIICDKHGDYEIRADSYHNGNRCKQCAAEVKAQSKITKAIAQHGSGLEKYPSLKKYAVRDFHAKDEHKIPFRCPDCAHEWTLSPYSQMIINGCPQCDPQAKTRMKNHIPTMKSLTHGSIADQKPEIVAQWSPKNDLTTEQVSCGSAYRATWTCEINPNHEWESFVYQRAGKKETGCPQCNISGIESEIGQLLSDHHVDFIRSNRKIIAPYELDIYIPEKNVAIEANGVYWHTEKQGKDRNYHYNKWKQCHDQGIQLITIWEDDWMMKKELIKKMILHKIGLSHQKSIYARTCSVKDVPTIESNRFLNTYHIQGEARGSVKIGLLHEGELVAISVWKKIKEDEWELSRYATSMNVVGGASKVIKAFIRQHSPSKIVTFADHEVSDGGLYEKLGFTADKEIKPDYKYVIDNKRIHKFNYRLKRFKSDPTLIYEEGLSESQLAQLNNIDRAWDCGKTRYILQLPLI